MYVEYLPRYLTSVLVEETEVGVVITWKLGDLVPTPAVLNFGYEVVCADLGGKGNRRFGVRFPSPSAYMWDSESDVHTDYEGEHINASDDAVIVYFRGADIGPREVGLVRGSSHINGIEGQRDFPVVLLRGT